MMDRPQDIRNSWDRDLRASGWAGLGVGTGLTGLMLGIGLIWKGPMAIVPVAITHSLAGLIGQSLFTSMDKYRISKGLEMMNQDCTLAEQASFRNIREGLVIPNELIVRYKILPPYTL